MAFADKLKELLTKNGLKAVDLARATGLSEAAISDYLKGKKEPRGRQSIAIARALNVSLDMLWETGYENNITNDSESKDITQAILQSPELKTLFEMTRDMSPEMLKAHIDFMKKMSELE